MAIQDKILQQKKHFAMKTSDIRNEQRFAVLMTGFPSSNAIAKCDEVFVNIISVQNCE